MIKGYYDVIKCKLNMPTIQPKLQMKEITPSTEEQYIIPDDGYDGLASAIVKAVTNEIDSNILPENIRLGKSILGISGNLEPDKPDQSKTVIPTTEEQTVRADEGYELAQVTVEAVTNEIDPNILPENIRLGKSILGIQGNLEPDKPDQNKTVTPSTVEQVIRADTGYELAQVTVEAVPDETPELNAQDTLLGNQETLIGQLESALDDKIALDLQAATSDATATAGDIVKDKTAYVNGQKVTGTYEGSSGLDWSAIGYSGVPQEVTNGFNHAQSIMQNWTVKSDYSYQFGKDIDLIFMPLVDTSSATNMDQMFEQCQSLITVPLLGTSNVTNIQSMFSNCGYLTSIPLLDTSNVTDMSYMFGYCYDLTSIPLLDTSNVTDMTAMFVGCSILETIPLLDTSNVISMTEMFVDCNSLTSIPLLNTSNVTSMTSMFMNCDLLTNQSLNNILQMCINATLYTETQTLEELGLSQSQAEICQTLSNWDAFVAAGWSTGY